MSKRRLIRFLLIIALSASACGDRSDATRDQPSTRAEGPQIRGDGATIPRWGEVVPGEWRLPALDYANTRYSELDRINADNVANLKVAATVSTGIAKGHEGQPLIVGSTMYMVTPFPNTLLAIDLRTPAGEVLWTYDPRPDLQAVGVACCDVVNRGASYADGKVVYNVLDGHTVAVDAESGEEVWKTKLGDVGRGETLTMAPLIVKDKVIVGNSGAELGVRGWVKALDLDNGEVLWTAYHTGPDEDVRIGAEFRPFYGKDRGADLGVTSWPARQWELGGSTARGWISYDAELDLIYYGTADPGTGNPDVRPGANKWSLTIFARDPDDGMARWAYQIAPHDSWDYDEAVENILVDAPINGRMRKLLVHPGGAGFVFVLDRETGEVLSAEPFQFVNWAERYDLETGLPVANPEKRTRQGRVTRNICPSSTGAKAVVPSSFSPRTGLLYIPSMHVCMDYQGMEANYIAGTPYFGAEVMMFPGRHGPRGELTAWDPIAARKRWGVAEDFPVYSGTLVTAGDVVFYGTLDGWFKALDARDGSELWRFKTGSGIVGNPVTYRGPDGRQYVAIYSGIGGGMGAVAFPEISMSDPTAAFGVVGAMVGIKEALAPGGAADVGVVGATKGIQQGTAPGGTLYVFSL